MPGEDLETCKTFVLANRLIAGRYKAKAEEVLEAVQSIEDISSRLLLADLSRSVEQRAAQYESLADIQERDMGIRCYCKPLDTRMM